MKLPWYRSLLSRRAPDSLVTVLDQSEQQNANGLAHWVNKHEPQSLAAALECFKTAAQLGHAGAQNNLGTMLAAGHGTSRDEQQAEDWFCRAARQGEAAAQFNLAVRYHRANMRGLSRDATEGRIQALMWFSLAAAQHYDKADQWCDRLSLDMTREEVLEAARRAKTFTATKEREP